MSNIDEVFGKFEGEENKEEKKYTEMSYDYIERNMCTVLEEMRKLHETHNYSSFLSLIEEIQMMGNRMEASLATKKHIIKLQEARHKIKKEVKELIQQRKSLVEEIDELKNLSHKRKSIQNQN